MSLLLSSFSQLELETQVLEDFTIKDMAPLRPTMLKRRFNTDKFALLWGEAQKKIAYCYPKVT